MDPKIIFACVAVIAVGIGIIMYTLLRPAKTPAKIGDVPSIDLGEETPDEADDSTAEAEAESEIADEAEEPTEEAPEADNEN